jgi:hypothetical protein
LTKSMAGRGNLYKHTVEGYKNQSLENGL